MMQNSLSLRSYMGTDKTLIITCHECFREEINDGQVYTYQCLGNMLRKDDQLQQECIRYYVEVKQCRRIILAGHYDCQIIQKILTVSDVLTPLSFLQYNLEKMLKEHANNLWHPEIKKRMLIELNVLEQLKLLMDYSFIKEKVTNGLLNVTGIVLNHHSSTAEEIFRNGFTFNNLVDLN